SSGHEDELRRVHQRPDRILHPLTPVTTEPLGGRVARQGLAFQLLFDPGRLRMQVIRPGDWPLRAALPVDAGGGRDDALVVTRLEQGVERDHFFGSWRAGQYPAEQSVDQIVQR